MYEYRMLSESGRALPLKVASPAAAKVVAEGVAVMLGWRAAPKLLAEADFDKLRRAAEVAVVLH